jgi:hypothetical protein
VKTKGGREESELRKGRAIRGRDKLCEEEEMSIRINIIGYEEKEREEIQ